ncbi:MAG: efflux transporter outer membrane subunit [Candidatus Ratteibacteria bacterium]|jgi:multidrug efflux system outer membrane protein
MRNITLAIILSTILLAGCRTAQIPHKSPDLSLPSQWKEYSLSENEDTAPHITWREFYLDENLREIISLALKNNRDLRTTASTIEKTRALYQIQRAERLPTVGASGDASYQHLPASLSGQGRAVTLDQYSVSVGVSAWELDFFNRISHLKESALEHFFATEQARQSAQIALASEIANVYLLLSGDQQRLALAEKTRTNQNQSYQLILKRFQNGISSELDVKQAQTRIEAANIDIARYRGMIATDISTLQLLAGTTIPPSLLPESLSPIIIRETIAPGIPSEILLRRPDILMAEHLLKAANANIEVARAAFFPRITLTGNLGTASNDLGSLFTAGSDIWAFAPKISLPIFDSGRRKSALKVAQAERESTLALYEQAIQKAFKEVSDTLVMQQSIEEQLRAQTALVESTSEVFRLAELRYNHGIGNYLIVLDAQRSLYAAQIGLLSLQQAKYANLVMLYKVLGGGAVQGYENSIESSL